MSSVTLGQRIREARKQSGLTQVTLAERIRSHRPDSRIDPVTLSRYERGKHSPRYAVLVAIAEATEQPLEFFNVADDTATETAEADADEDDADTMFTAANELERQGNYAIADALRHRARQAKMRAARVRAKAAA